MNLQTNTIRKNTIYQSKDIKQNKYTFWLEWATMPYLGKSPLIGMGSYGSMEEWRRQRVNGLRGKWSQGTHMGIITIGSEGVS